ncbi:MAG: hypothetical protein JRG73_20040, partial [Deltaproteobacteria bacterium]|nr:hypothetical protein [Deltaproteobacteria bacterium]
HSEEAVPHKTLLYGEELAGHAIIVVEGPTDAWRIGPGAVATMGLGYSSEQVIRIKNHPVRAVCFDKSIEAQTVARKLAAALSVFPGQTFVASLDAADPGSAAQREVCELRRRFLKRQC